MRSLFKRGNGDRITIECSTCGNSQEESSLALSTICKTCSQYLKIEKGKAIASGSPIQRPSFLDEEEEDEQDSPSDAETSSASSKKDEEKTSGVTVTEPQARPVKPDSDKTLSPKAEKPKSNHEKAKQKEAPKPSNGEQQELFSTIAVEKEVPKDESFDASFKEYDATTEKTPKVEDKPDEDFDASFKDDINKPASQKTDTKVNVDDDFDSSFTEDTSVDSEKYISEEDAEERYKGSDRANRFYSYKGNSREKLIECYECFKAHSALKDASSSMCPNCGTYIALKDYEISNFWTSTIRTRGDVKITKKGNVRNVTVFCDNMLVEGELNATADCSGELRFKNSCRVTGHINCMKLVIEKNVSVVFERAVRSVEVEIYGKANATLKESEKVTIFKNGALEGPLETKTFEVKQGGTHSGNIKILEKDSISEKSQPE